MPGSQNTQSSRRDWANMVLALAAILTVLVTVITFAITTNNTNAANRDANQANLAQQRLTAQGQITDRYTAAVDQLGSDQPEVRLGGIYALERIMNDSKPDQPTIVEVLFTFIRYRAPNPCPNGRDHPENDVQAALTVLGRRNPKLDLGKARSDLSSTCLIGANLTNANLPGVNLTYTDLTCAHLPGAHLENADMNNTYLSKAHLSVAKLTNATLTNTVLHDAYLTGGDLTGATLDHVNLTHAAVTKQQLAEAKRLIATKPPKGSPRPSRCPL